MSVRTTTQQDRMPTQHLTWNDVVQVHRSQSGISTRGNTVTSLLCNQHKEGYADEVYSDKIIYMVTSSTNPKHVVLLRQAVGSGKTVRVFEKLAVNRWQDHGYWCISKVAEQDDGYAFLLVRG